MANPVNIYALADEIVTRLKTPRSVKVAHAEPVPPLIAELRKVAAALRTDALDGDALYAPAVKLASTGAQAQGAGATAVQGLPPPTLPGLSTGNLGMTAGGGGALPEPKLAAELRRVAAQLRAEDASDRATKVAHTTQAAAALKLLGAA